MVSVGRQVPGAPFHGTCFFSNLPSQVSEDTADIPGLGSLEGISAYPQENALLVMSYFYVSMLYYMESHNVSVGPSFRFMSRCTNSEYDLL